MAIRTTYLRPWQPPPFSPSRSSAGIPRGTGVEEGGAADRVGTVRVVVRPPGAVASGTSVTLTAVRTGGSAPMTYQWHDPTDAPIPGATGNSYTFTATTSGTYKVVVDSPGAVDAPLAATVAVVVAAPVVIGTITITASPTGPVALGTSVTLTAVRTGGSAPLTYAWTEFGIPIPNQTGPTLAITATVSGDYRVTVTSAGATDSPQSATYSLVVQVAGEPWTPADMTTFAWFDAADTSTITLDTGNASEWKDKSGNSRHAVQPLAGNQHSFLSVGINGLGTLIASASGKGMSLPAPDGSFPDGFNACYVFRCDSQTGLMAGPVLRTRGNQGCFFERYDLIYVNMHPGSTSFDIKSITTPSAVFSSVAPISASESRGAEFLDGTQAASHVFSLYEDTATAVQIGMRADGATSLVGAIAEIVVIKGVVAAVDREKLEGYLAHKWGTSAKLPANHPYKAAPPTK